MIESSRSLLDHQHWAIVDNSASNYLFGFSKKERWDKKKKKALATEKSLSQPDKSDLHCDAGGFSVPLCKLQYLLLNGSDLFWGAAKNIWG